jgi:hypothetical protein
MLVARGSKDGAPALVHRITSQVPVTKVVKKNAGMSLVVARSTHATMKSATTSRTVSWNFQEEGGNDVGDKISELRRNSNLSQCCGA